MSDLALSSSIYLNKYHRERDGNPAGISTERLG
jgi:hypothetical protein